MFRPYVAGTIVALAAALCACGRPSADKVESSTAVRQADLSKQARNVPAQTTAASAFRYGERTQTQTPDPAWLAAARDDPDPNVRLHALGTWAQYAGESLDPVTYALVDPDETVRARAQELMEEALARR